MTNKDYNKLLSWSRTFLHSGRNYHLEITPEELLHESFIFLDAKNIEDVPMNDFWIAFKKARAKLVKNIFDQRPELRYRHNKIVAKYRDNNKEKISKRRSELYSKRCKEENRILGKPGAPKGSKHGKFIGIYCTPFGEYESSYAAAEANNMTAKCVRDRCKSKSTQFQDWYIKKNSAFNRN